MTFLLGITVLLAKLIDLEAFFLRSQILGACTSSICTLGTCIRAISD